MLLSERDRTDFKNWLQRELRSLSDADPVLLSDYVLALVKDSRANGFKYNCIESLREFIGDRTPLFVDKMLNCLTRYSSDSAATNSSNITNASGTRYHDSAASADAQSLKRKDIDPTSLDNRKYRQKSSDNYAQTYKRRRTHESSNNNYVNNITNTGDDSRRYDQEEYRSYEGQHYTRREVDYDRREANDYREYRRERSKTNDRYEAEARDTSRHCSPSVNESAAGANEEIEEDRGSRMSRTRGGASRGGDRGRGFRGRGGRGRGGKGRRFDEAPPITGEAITDKNGNEIIVLHKDRLDASDQTRLPSLNTLIISSIPDEATLDALYKHFIKFGNIVNIMIKLHSHKAFVQFEQTESAKAALHSPDAVLGNRFVKLGWAKTKPEPPVNVAASAHALVLNKPSAAQDSAEKVKELTAIVQKKNELLNQQITLYKDILSKIDDIKEATKEKLELLQYTKKLEANIKKLQQEQQEATARLASIQAHRPTTQQIDSKKEQPEKETELEEKAVTSESKDNDHPSTTTTTIANDEAEESKGSSEETATKEQENGTNAQFTFQRGRGRGRGATIQRGRGRGAWRGGRGASAALVMKPRKLTLDNRTTTLQVSEIPEEGKSEESIRKHFEQFGEIESIEPEESNVYNIKFANRNSAQKAIELGKTYYNSQLKFQWKQQPQQSTSIQSEETPVPSSEDEGESDREEASWKR